MLRPRGPEASNVNLSIGKSAMGPSLSQKELRIAGSEAGLDVSAIDIHLGQPLT